MFDEEFINLITAISSFVIYNFAQQQGALQSTS